MDYVSNSWHIALAYGDNEFLLNMWLRSGEGLFKYHIFPESVTKKIAEVQIPGQGRVKMIPVFLQATLEVIDYCAADSDEDIGILLPHENKSIDDRTMRLAIYLSGIRPSEVNISALPIESFSKKTRPSYETFGTAGSFQGYRTITD